MNIRNTVQRGYADGMVNLRTHDIIAKTAHVSYKDTLRVLIALRAVGKELDLSTDEILSMPYSREKPTPQQAHACSVAYLRMHETECLRGYLCEVEQLT